MGSIQPSPAFCLKGFHAFLAIVPAGADLLLEVAEGDERQDRCGAVQDPCLVNSPKALGVKRCAVAGSKVSFFGRSHRAKIDRISSIPSQSFARLLRVEADTASKTLVACCRVRMNSAACLGQESGLLPRWHLGAPKLKAATAASVLDETDASAEGSGSSLQDGPHQVQPALLEPRRPPEEKRSSRLTARRFPVTGRMPWGIAERRSKGGPRVCRGRNVNVARARTTALKWWATRPPQRPRVRRDPRSNQFRSSNTEAECLVGKPSGPPTPHLVPSRSPIPSG